MHHCNKCDGMFPVEKMKIGNRRGSLYVFPTCKQCANAAWRNRRYKKLKAEIIYPPLDALTVLLQSFRVAFTRGNLAPMP